MLDACVHNRLSMKSFHGALTGNVHKYLLKTSIGKVSTEVLNRLHVVGNGVEAMSFLRKQAPYSDAPRPDLTLLDLNLSKKDGREVLAEIKTDKDLKSIPVVRTTTGMDERDVLKAYDNHANCYIVKPVDFDQFASVMRAIEHFWFTVVTLPTAERHGCVGHHPPTDPK
jgi:two-component system, chemotaxis family, response regulator Rcp1